MTKLVLTPDEAKVVGLYASALTTIRSRLPIWALELGLPLACAVYGTVTRNSVFLGAAIGGLLGLNAFRMFRQFKYAREFHSICLKVENHLASGKADA
jgi:hypothetical protein